MSRNRKLEIIRQRRWYKEHVTTSDEKTPSLINFRVTHISRCLQLPLDYKAQRTWLIQLSSKQLRRLRCHRLLYYLSLDLPSLEMRWRLTFITWCSIFDAHVTVSYFRRPSFNSGYLRAVSHVNFVLLLFQGYRMLLVFVFRRHGTQWSSVATHILFVCLQYVS